jgi:hypothetical protein
VKHPSACRSGALRLSIALAGLAAGRLVAADPVVGPLVHLPNFTVKGQALPADEKPWSYTAFGGYEILSQASDAVTGKLADHLVRFSDLIERIYPGVQGLPEPRIRIILCAERPVFESFIPAKVGAEFGAGNVNRLFFDEAGGPRIVLYAGPLEHVGTYEVDLCRAYLAARLRGAFPRLPEWYIEGASRIYAAAQLTEWSKNETIIVGKLDNHQPLLDTASVATMTSGSDPSAGITIAVAAGSGTVADPARTLSNDVAKVLQGDVLATPLKQSAGDLTTAPPDPDGAALTFMKYFSDSSRPYPPLADVFAEAPTMKYLDWTQSCGLFVHFCLFNQSPRRQKELYDFIVSSSRQPSGDGSEEFQSAFKASYGDMGKTMGWYSVDALYVTKRYSLPKPTALEAAIAPQPATGAEIADIKAAAYACTGYPERAEEALVTAYHREKAAGHFDPRLITALGIWDADHERGEEADALLAMGMAGKYPEPKLYTALARRRLERHGDKRPLTGAETADCLEPLATARAVGAADAQVYDLAATIWVKSAEPPPTADLQVLMNSVKEYPADGDLAYDVTLAFLRAGKVLPAKAIVQHEIAVGDPETRMRFAALESDQPALKAGN